MKASDTSVIFQQQEVSLEEPSCKSPFEDFDFAASKEVATDRRSKKPNVAWFNLGIPNAAGLYDTWFAIASASMYSDELRWVSRAIARDFKTCLWPDPKVTDRHYFAQILSGALSLSLEKIGVSMSGCVNYDDYILNGHHPIVRVEITRLYRGPYGRRRVWKRS